MKVQKSNPLDENLEILDLERVISHMEVDMSYHQSQTRLFETKIKEAQEALGNLHDQIEERESLRRSGHRMGDGDRGDFHEM